MHILQTRRCVDLLKLRHPRHHYANASGNRLALSSSKPSRDAHHPRRIGDEIALAAGCRRRQGSRQITPKGRCVLPPRNHVHETLAESTLLRSRQRRLVLDAVRDPAQQVRVADRVAQVFRKLRYRQCERSRHAAKGRALVREVPAPRPLPRLPLRHTGQCYSSREQSRLRFHSRPRRHNTALPPRPPVRANGSGEAARGAASSTQAPPAPAALYSMSCHGSWRQMPVVAGRQRAVLGLEPDARYRLSDGTARSVGGGQ